MSYLKMSSVIVAIADGDSPARRAAAYSELVISPLVTTVRVEVSRRVTFSLMSSPARLSSTRLSASRSKRMLRRSPDSGMSKAISAPGRSLVSASRAPGCSSTRCRVVAGMPALSNRSLRVWPRWMRSTCQLSPGTCCWRAMVNGGSGSARLVWLSA